MRRFLLAAALVAGFAAPACAGVVVQINNYGLVGYYGGARILVRT